MKKQRGFTLLEIMVVIIIIGVLATLGLVNYRVIIEGTYDKKAQSNLKLIRAAERIYRMEQGNFFPCLNTDEVNDNLRLSIPNPPNPLWTYSVTTDPADPAVFTGSAVRETTDTAFQRSWCIDQDPDKEPYECGGGGP